VSALCIPVHPLILSDGENAFEQKLEVGERAVVWLVDLSVGLSLCSFVHRLSGSAGGDRRRHLANAVGTLQ